MGVDQVNDITAHTKQVYTEAGNGGEFHDVNERILEKYGFQTGFLHIRCSQNFFLVSRQLQQCLWDVLWYFPTRTRAALGSLCQRCAQSCSLCSCQQVTLGTALKGTALTQCQQSLTGLGNSSSWCFIEQRWPDSFYLLQV